MILRQIIDYNGIATIILETMHPDKVLSLAGMLEVGLVETT
ncbi:hypothetical protein [uncultured Duncaniella sp.]|nr:hypothetical protein [uncultured Duncaniella sp.]